MEVSLARSSSPAWFGRPRALVISMIAFLIFTSGASIVFMLAFLRALTREVRMHRARRSSDQRKQKSLTLTMLERYRRRDLAA